MCFMCSVDLYGGYFSWLATKSLACILYMYNITSLAKMWKSKVFSIRTVFGAMLTCSTGYYVPNDTFLFDFFQCYITVRHEHNKINFTQYLLLLLSLYKLFRIHWAHTMAYFVAIPQYHCVVMEWTPEEINKHKQCLYYYQIIRKNIP